MSPCEQPPDFNRVRWLARRGMLELDVWLSRFITRRYPALDVAQQARFVYLLEQDDMTLYDWFTAEVDPPEEFGALVTAIRSLAQP